MTNSMITALHYNKIETSSNSTECSFATPAKICSTQPWPEDKTLISSAKDVESCLSISKTDKKNDACFTVSHFKLVRH